MPHPDAYGHAAENAGRRARAHLVLARYVELAGDSGEHVVNVSDLIADLLHTCTADDAITAVESAQHRYDEEADTAGERTVETDLAEDR